jgi:hypothetical protein
MNQLRRIVLLTTLLLAAGAVLALASTDVPPAPAPAPAPALDLVALGILEAPKTPAIEVDPLAQIRLTTCFLNCPKLETLCQTRCNQGAGCGGYTFECDMVACTTYCECCP